MGLSCKKQTGKFKGYMRKLENEMEVQKKTAKKEKNKEKK